MQDKTQCAAGEAAARAHTDTLLHRFDQAAARHPAAVAVRTERSAVTYGMLAEASHALAERLAGTAAGRPGPVAVLRKPGPGQLCAALAALRCGKPYLPVDLAYPQHRIDRILTEAAPAMVVGGHDPLPDGTRRGLLGAREIVDSAPLTPGRWGDATEVTGHDAYVIYTSGSTGIPKGIVIPHHGILNLLDDFAIRQELPPGSRQSALTSPGFDVSVWEAWSSLTSGGELLITPDGQRWHAASFVAWLAEQDIVSAYAPAAFLPTLAQAAGRGDLRSLRRLMVAAEPIPRGVLGAIKRGLPELTLLNAYGPTEASVVCVIYEVTEHDDGPERTPIGTPIRNTHLLVEPRDVEPVEVEPVEVDGTIDDGAALPQAPGERRGELHIGGVCVGRYLRPEQGERPAYYWRTAEDGTRLPYYRTGDVVRVDSAGVYTFLGRIDDMVKVRGYRVEPGDVEGALLEHSGVAQALVFKQRVPDGSGSGTEQLVAYVVPVTGAQLRPTELQDRLREKLPWYAVPHRVVVRDAFPLTPHGKIDRRALAADPPPEPAVPAEPAAAAPLPMQPQQTGADPDLLRLWHEVLGPTTPDPHLSFLANGGDSLAAGRLAWAVTKRLGRHVQVLDILLAGSLDELQTAVRGAPAVRVTEEAADGPPPPRPPRPGEPVPATSGQRALWFHTTAHPGSPVYNEMFPLRLRGRLDTAVLGRALDRIVARHEALRTGLVMRGDQLQQVVRPPAPLELTAQDLRATPPDELGAATDEAVRRAVRAPYDLAAGPQLRAHLLRTGDEEHLLVLSMHHSTIDGWSVDILFEELSALYTAFAAGEEPELAPPSGQYADHALWQHALADGGHLDEDLAYWRRQLSGLPASLDLPTDLPRPERPSGEGALVRDRFSPDLVARVDALARSTGVTRYTALLAALQLLLSRYCGTRDVSVGTPFSGRDRPETERSVGYYINMLPLRADLSGSPTFRELLTRTRRTVADAQAHQRVPFALLVEHLGVAPRDETPFLQACLVPEDVYRHEMDFAGLHASFEYYDIGIAKFDLTVNLIPDAEGGLRLTAEYRTDLFQAATVQRLLGHLETLLESATADPDARATGLRMLTDAERAQVLGSFDGETRPFPVDAGVHHLVDRRAAQTPDALALIGEADRLTYRELVERANRLAYYLADRGAEPGTRVGVCLPRGTDAVIAFLAILKTGGAYVPLDPAYPADRLSFMAENAQLVLNITPGFLREGRQAIAGCPAHAPAVATTGDDIAYVIYTSGSTGRPKGVRIRHRGIVDLVVNADYAQIDRGARLLHAASLSFDMTAFDVWGTLANGAQLVVAPGGSLPSHHIASLIKRHGITHGHMATALFHRQVEEIPSSLAGLRTLIVGGEALGPSHAATALAVNPGLRLINGYGPTEATTCSTYHVLTHPDEVTDPVPIGRPTPNTEVRILDPHGQPVPIGVPGELHLGGPGLADGYLDEPHLTRQRFIPDPCGGSDPSRRLYRTGDLARFRPDGTIDFLGRIDDQIKLHGHRIEPGEIETVLRAHPGITGAIVTRREDQQGQPYLAAYYTTTPGARISSPELTGLAAARLPAPLVPRAFMELESFPITAGGKIDRAALPPPPVARDPGKTEPGAAAAAGDDLGALQEQIAAIWRSVLTADAIGPDERLFDIGGASLQVTRIHQRVAARFGLPELALIDLFSHPTLRTYAAHVHRLRTKEQQR